MAALVDKTVKFVEESTTLKEQLRCFFSFWFLLPTCTFSSALLLWFLYFSLTIIFTFFHNELNISPDGWKEKCTLKKFGIVMVGIIEDESGYKIEDLFANLRDIIQQKAPLLLGLYDLVVAPAASDGVVDKFQDALTQLEDADDLVSDDQLSMEYFEAEEEEEESNLETQAEWWESSLDITYVELNEALAREVLLKEQLEQSRVEIEVLKKVVVVEHTKHSELKAQNGKLEFHCLNLYLSLMEALKNKQSLEEQVDQLKADNLEMLYEMQSMVIDQAGLTEEYKLQIFKLNETLEDLEIQKNELLAKSSIEAGKFEHLLPAQASEFEEQNMLEIADLNETIEELETAIEELENETRFLDARLSIESSNVEGLENSFSGFIQHHEYMEAEWKKTIEELESDKEELHARLSVEACNAEHFRALSSEYEEQHKLEEAKLEEIIENLKAENKDLHERLSTAANNFEDFRKVSSDRIEQHKVEKDKLNEYTWELEFENDQLTANLYDALSKIEHYWAQSSEYKEANESLQQEKDILLMNLQKAKESEEFHKKLLDLDYAIV